MAKSDKYYPSELPFLSESTGSADQNTSKRKSSTSQDSTPRKRAESASTLRKVSAKQQPYLNRSSPLYLQLHIDNLAIHLNCGLFYPVAWEPDVIYKENREARPDILTKFPNYLVFSTGIIGTFREREILLEIALAPQEQEQLQVVGPCLLYPDALPISRIQQIMFASEVAQKEYLASRDIFDDFFFPDKLITAKSPFLSKTPLPTSLVEPPASDKADFSQCAAQFDKVLGMFAFMKNASLLRANYTGKVSEWDSSFLTALSLVNRATGTQQSTNVYIFRTSLTFKPVAIPDGTSERQRLFHDIIAHIYKGELFTYDWAANTLSNYPTLQSFARVFKDLQADGTISFKRAIGYFRDRSERPDQNIPLILLVLLGKFSNRDRTHTDKQAVRIHFTQDKSITEAETAVCTAILGLYYGYKSMMRDDKNIQLDNKFFTMLLPSINRIKFQINLFLDRYIVESIFQYSYNQNTFLEDPLSYIKIKQEPYIVTPSIPTGYTSQASTVLGQSIINIEQSKWASYIERLPQTVPLSHPVINILSILNAGIPREVVSKLLDNIPKEYQGAATVFLNTLLLNQVQK